MLVTINLLILFLSICFAWTHFVELIYNKIEYLDAVKVLTNSNTTNNKHIYCKFISLHLIFFLLFQYRGLAYSPLGGPRGGGPLIGGAIEPGDAPTGLLA